MNWRNLQSQNLVDIYICRWNFLDSSEAIRKQEYSDTLPRASVQDLGVLLMGAGYEVIQSYYCLLYFLSHSHFVYVCTCMFLFSFN